MATATGVGAAGHVIIGWSSSSASASVPLSVLRSVFGASSSHFSDSHRTTSTTNSASASEDVDGDEELILIAVVFVISAPDKSKISKSMWRR